MMGKTDTNVYVVIFRSRLIFVVDARLFAVPKVLEVAVVRVHLHHLFAVDRFHFLLQAEQARRVVIGDNLEHNVEQR